MNLAHSLQQHLALCAEIHLVLLEENRLLQTSRRPPGEAFLARKAELLPRLDAACAVLSNIKQTCGDEVHQHSAMIERLQKKMLSLLLLDRENEKLLLKCSMQPEVFRVAAKPASHLVSRAYTSAAAA